MSDHPYAERMAALCLSFPSLFGKFGNRAPICPWNADALAKAVGTMSQLASLRYRLESQDRALRHLAKRTERT